MFSKETLDHVKLAKQYIENRYQSIINQEIKNKENWNKIIQLIEPGGQNVGQIIQNVVRCQMINKRIHRIKDTLDNYQLYSVIGRGAFGQVRLAKNIITNEVVAIKRLEKKYLMEKKQIYNAYLERDLMVKNSCEFIVQMKSTFQDQDFLYFAMEYVQGGDLLHLLIERDTLSEEQTKFYVAEMILAVQQIHKMNYIHRDIKPDNILIDKTGHIKISDFGLSKYLEYGTKIDSKNSIRLSKMEKLKKLTQIKNKQKSFSKVGTPDYISPEVLIQKIYDHSVDLWGIGVITFECLFGYPPFTDESSKEVCHKVANWIDYLEFPPDKQISTAAKMLILGLVNDSQRRLTISQIKTHPFFEGIDWEHIRKIKPPFIPDIKDEIDATNFDDFQLKTPWTQEEKRLISKFNRKQAKSKPRSQRLNNDSDNQLELTIEVESKSRATVGPKFKFAGFDYRKISQDPLEAIAVELQRKSYSTKCLKKTMPNSRISSVKHLKTEQNQSLTPAKKKLMKPKKSLTKTRPSYEFLTNTSTNNTSSSFLFRKFETSKQFLHTLGNQQNVQKEQKQNIHYKSNIKASYDCDSSSGIKKKPAKGKVQKIKQIYGAEAQKLKLKKLVSIQTQIKNY